MKKLHYWTLLVSSLVGFAGIAHETTTNFSQPKLEFLFVQMASEATFQANPQKQGTYLLTLSRANPYVKYFTDRPERIAGMMSTNTFLSEWQHNFKQAAPNAGIYGLQKEKPLTVSMELQSPVYNPQKQSITYIAAPLNKEIKLPEKIQLKDVAVFIDDFCASCSGGGF